MIYTVGIDVGSTYAKALVLSSDMRIAGRAMTNTGFKLAEVARKLFDRALAEADLAMPGWETTFRLAAGL